jgi:methyl-accepting chemotaxis protein
MAMFNAATRSTAVPWHHQADGDGQRRKKDKPMNQLKIGTRLGLAFCAMLLITALIAVVAVWRLGTLADTSQSIATINLDRSMLAQRWTAYINLNWVRASAALKTSDPGYIDTLQKDMSATTKVTSDTQQKLESLLQDDKGKTLMADVARSRAIYLAARGALLEKKKAGADVAALVDRDLRPLAETYLRALDAVVAHSDALMAAVVADALRVASSSRWTVAVSALLCLVLGLLLAIFVTRSITGPIGVAVDTAQAISGGDLHTPVHFTGQDETAWLLQALSVMQDKLAGIVGDVRLNAEGVAVASAQIAKGNLDLSSRTEEQASALEQTAASMEELSSTIGHNADNARQGNQLALSASAVAVKGGEVVSQVVQTMKGINDASKRIADIIGVIDGIAFQTNILALNAAVEAARAGEQGRGFAVVASEVRSLAGRSADAAKEIKGLISTSVERVAQGTTLVDQAGATMTEVVSSIQRVTDIMGAISAASQQQSAGIAQVGQAVTQIDQATQQNAALVEQSAAAAESLKSQAQQLVDSVVVFKLDAEQSSGTMRIAQHTSSRSDPSRTFPAAERRGPTLSTQVAPLFPKPREAQLSPTTRAATRRSDAGGGWAAL